MSNEKDEISPNLKQYSEMIVNIANDIFAGEETSNFLGLGSESLENVAYHDFSEYHYVRDPVLISPPSGLISDQEIFQFIEDPNERVLLEAIGGKINDLIVQHYAELTEEEREIIMGRILTTLITEPTGTYQKLTNLYKTSQQLGNFYVLELINSLPIIPSGYTSWCYIPMSIGSPGSGSAICSVAPFYDFIQKMLNYTHSDVYLERRWAQIVETARIHWVPIFKRLIDIQERKIVKGSLIYPFELYQPLSWNIGLRTVYRQEWRPLGNQRGEVIRTIPLGPKQVEKVSTKIIRRTKVTKTVEKLKSVEATTEVTDTTKDSTEIVNEAVETQGWNTEAEASVNLGGFASAGISGGMHEETENRTRETSNHLSELMQKTASKIRTETKTVVSTESESTLEITTASEIENPNDEIPITYVYSKLQRQYEIFTYLAELQNVVMIAEQIPFPYEINFDWVKKYDWIIAKVLLDDSFRDGLNSISQNPSPKDRLELVEDLAEKLNDIQEFFKDFSKQALSLANVDIVQEAQKNYREALEMNYENQKLRALLDHKKERLYQHIRDNILHYCRAIWSQEDPQQKILRYKRLKIKIPIVWDFVGALGTTQYDSENTLDELLNQVQLHETDADVMTNFDIEGDFVANWEETVDITDIINPSGPIGYYGNYAIYYIKPEFSRVDIFTILQILKTPYLFYPSAEETPILMDPTLKRLTIENIGKTPSEEEKVEMIDLIYELRILYNEILGSNEEEIDNFFNNNDLFKKFYPEYLFKKERTRRFLLDTNNLIIDIEPGKGTALEPFKLAHRGLDVLKALEEKKSIELENQRRENLLKKQKYDSRYWPGTQKIIFFEGKENEESEQSTEPSSAENIIFSYPISEIGVLSEIAVKLEELGITTTIEFLKKCKTPDSRRKLVKVLEIANIDLLKLATITDLMRIKGIGESQAVKLQVLEVDSVKELARKKIETFYPKLENYGKAENVKVPSKKDVKNWIKQAKNLTSILKLGRS